MDDETAPTQSNVRICPKTGRQTKRFVKSRTSLTGTLARLHLLLRSTYFSTWPLEVRFFSADVYHVWQRWTETADGFMSDTIPVIPDFNLDQRDFDKTTKDAISRLDINNAKSKDYMEKAIFILDTDERIDCGVCHSRLNLDDDFIVLCSHDPCRCAFHLLCLSTALVGREDAVDATMIPISGRCPGCHARVEWPILMKEMTMRTRNWEVEHLQKQHNDIQVSAIGEDPREGDVIGGGKLDRVKGVEDRAIVDLISSDEEDPSLSKLKRYSTYSDVYDAFA